MSISYHSPFFYSMLKQVMLEQNQMWMSIGGHKYQKGNEYTTLDHSCTTSCDFCQYLDCIGLWCDLTGSLITLEDCIPENCPFDKFNGGRIIPHAEIRKVE